MTGAEAQDGSRIAAGGLNNPIILDRVAAGLSVSQLVTDFGRTSDLVQTASLRAEALQQNVITDRADVLLRVDRAYFNALRAQAILRVAQETVNARQLGVDQVGALAQSNLKSGLDVSFAKVNLSEAQLLLLQARNDASAALAALAAALGQQDAPTYTLGEEPLAASAAGRRSGRSSRRRCASVPTWSAERLVRESSAKFADAEHALWFPTISAIGAAGVAPFHQDALSPHYAAIGVNVIVPLTNGNLFAARHAEASLRARAEGERLRDLENRVARDVRVALLDAQAAFQRLDLTNQLLDQAAPGAGAGRVALQPRAQLDRRADAGAVEQDAGGDRAGKRTLRLPGADGRAAIPDRGAQVGAKRHTTRLLALKSSRISTVASSTVVTMSCVCTPAVSAGLPGSTSATTTPVVFERRRPGGHIR